MPIAMLDFADFAVIALIVSLLAGGAAAGASYLPTADRDRLRRVEHKLDLVMTHFDLDYTPPPKSGWQEMAADPARKISAIKAYREEHGAGLAEAKRSVEAYIAEAGAHA